MTFKIDKRKRMLRNMNWVMDTREKNAVFMSYTRGNDWSKKRLVLTDFMRLPSGLIDLDCGDMTCHLFWGIVEFKSFGDMVGSTTREGVYHLEEQACKMFSTGRPFAIIVYGNRRDFQQKSGVSDELILDAYQKFITVCAVYGATASHVESPHDAVETAKTYLRKCLELPRRMPVYNKFKKLQDWAVASLCGYPDIGAVIGSNIITAYGSLRNFYKILDKELENTNIKKTAKKVSKPVAQLGPKKLEGIIKTYCNIQEAEA
jgi:ERCC4-type nuclease